MPGPLILPGRALPGRNLAGSTSANAAVLNHCAAVCGAPLFGSPSWSGRADALVFGSSSPSPAGSAEIPVTVRGNPALNVMIPDNSQPPNACPRKPCCDLSHGITQTKLALKI